MKDFECVIERATKNLTAKEKIMMKDTGNATPLDEATKDEPLKLDYAYHVVLAIHNEKSDHKDYKVCIVVDKSGNKYSTSSDAFLRSLEQITDEMYDPDTDKLVEDFTLECYRRPSKNYKGKDFLTCSLVG